MVIRADRYGHSEGSPSETGESPFSTYFLLLLIASHFTGLRIDAQTALNYVTSHPSLQNSPVVIISTRLQESN
jgi:abhydrolase domain-containing protein 13